MLETSSFFFSHNVFYFIKGKLCHLIDWMVFYAAFNSISVISRRITSFEHI